MLGQITPGFTDHQMMISFQTASFVVRPENICGYSLSKMATDLDTLCHKEKPPGSKRDSQQF